jgi:BlaI family transcriptional regulator, penicillinase repressor
MRQLKLSKLELRILEAIWTRRSASIREIQETFSEPRPAYTTIQTTVYRLEGKKAVRRIGKVSNAHVFECLVARDAARASFLDEVLGVFGGRALPMMAQLAEAGRLTLDDVKELEQTIRSLSRRKRDQREGSE